MRDFFSNLVSGLSVWDFIDIAIITFVIYKTLSFIRETRAEQLIKGIIVLVAAMALSGLLHLYALNWLLKGVMQFGVVALVVVFQPELRRALEFVGRSKFIKAQFADMNKEKVKWMTSSIITAVEHFSDDKVGALIIMEREIALSDFAETGVVLNASLTTELLASIFYEGAPLHDGAVIVRGGNIYAAACMLPLSRGRDLSTELGTRHRAGIGITEISDALAIIVSEETGIISIAVDGKLTRFLEIKTLEKIILNMFLSDQKPNQNATLLSFFRRKKDVS
ncbi:MAG: diadenylate cyclase CdaA [Clostridiales Family XIII bacterium]|jgi:diadenylate cyclase|nr:diadenylate cyclase CdaA [Clostridiales Family XIII bacterium]